MVGLFLTLLENVQVSRVGVKPPHCVPAFDAYQAAWLKDLRQTSNAVSKATEVVTVNAEMKTEEQRCSSFSRCSQWKSQSSILLKRLIAREGMLVLARQQEDNTMDTYVD